LVIFKDVTKNNRKMSFRREKLTPFFRYSFVTQVRYTVKTDLCLRYEGKTGKERNLVTFKDAPMNNRIDGELSTRPFSL